MKPSLRGLRIGLLTSVGETLDAFFPPLIEEWTRRGHTIFPASGTAARTMESAVLNAVTRRPSIPALRSGDSLRHWVTTNRLDVIVTNTAVASALVRSSVTKVPIVYFCHGLHWASRGDWRSRILWEPIERALLSRTAAAIALNDHDEKWFLRHMPRQRVLRLRAGVGVPLSLFPAAGPIDDPTLRMAWIGEFSKRKRPSDALAVLEHLRKEGVDARLSMYGTGPLHEALRRKVIDRGLEDRVSIPGRGNVAQVLAESNLLLHTAAWEGLVRVALEAAAVGRWTYGYRVKGVVDTPAARVVPYGDSKGLAALIAGDFRCNRLGDLPVARSSLEPQIAASEIAKLLETVA